MAATHSRRSWNGRSSPAERADTLIDQFDEMLLLSRRWPLVFNLSLHPFLVGWPFRLQHLRRVLAHIARHRGEVWLTRPGAIAEHWRAREVRRHWRPG